MEAILENVNLICLVHNDFPILVYIGHTGIEKVGGTVVSVNMAPTIKVGFQRFDVPQDLFLFTSEIHGQKIEFIRAFSLRGFASLVAHHR